MKFYTPLTAYETELERTNCPKKAWDNISNSGKTWLVETYPDQFPITRPVNKKQSSHKTKWRLYHKEARRLTLLQSVYLLPNADKPKVSNKEHFQSSEHYVIDHKISIWQGYKQNISVEDIASLINLRWITSRENCLKGTKVFVDEKNFHLLKEIK